MIVFIINLEEDLKRRNTMQARLDQTNLEYQFIPAINGTKLSDETLKKMVYDYPNCSLTKGEIGCSLSHLAIYQKMIDENIDQALILEDDAILPNNIGDILLKVQKLDNKNKPNVYLLNRITKYIENKKLDENFVEVYDAYCTHGYIINKKAAKNLIQIQTPIRFEADRWKYFRFFNCVTIYGHMPALINSDDESKLTSCLETDRAPLEKARKEYLNFLKKSFKHYQYFRIKSLLLEKYFFNIKKYID